MVCLLVFSGMAASIISVIFFLPHPQKILNLKPFLKLENTAEFLCVIVITHSVTLISLGNGNSRD